jgi:hypothetical protein
MLHLTVGRPTPNDLAAVLHQLPDTAFERTSRSTIPLLAYWRRPLDRLKEVFESLPASVPPDGVLCFEYPEPSGVTRSKASYSDLMYVSDLGRIAFEAKWTEPRYENVVTWLSKGRDQQHRRRVLDAWLDRIARFTTVRPTADRVSNLVYQLIHRTASACSGDDTSAVVVYQCFSDEGHQHEHVWDDLRALAQALGPTSGLSLCAQRIPVAPTPAYHELARRCERYTPSQRAAAIRLALWEQDLFTFGATELERVSQD